MARPIPRVDPEITATFPSRMGPVTDRRRLAEIYASADLLVHDHNPLIDFKLLYGTGALRLNDTTNTTEWHRALRYTIKAGMVFDVAELLADVRALVVRSYADDDPADAAARPRPPRS